MKELTIRLMVLEDIEAFERGFREQGWNPKPEIHKMYLEEQNRGLRKVFVAEIDGEAAGYLTLLPEAAHGPFAEKAGRRSPILMCFKNISAAAWAGG